MPEPDNRPDWSALIQSISDEEAVLVLGPDAIPYYRGGEEKTFSQLRADAILQEIGTGILHYYARDQLFQFRDAKAKQDARKYLRELTKQEEWQPDQELLRQIVGLPFSVILNLNPDRQIVDAFGDFWHAPQFDYFTTRDKREIVHLEYPDANTRPLIYNLVGSVKDKLDSVILDYNDLFNLLKNLLSDHGVPELLTQKLGEADNFVLLGVELERWDLQLLVHYINQLDSAFSNYNQTYPILCNISEDSRQFIIKQFNITHQSLSREDFSDIHSAATIANILRPLAEQGSTKGREIRRLIIQGNFPEAFKQLQIALTEEQRDIHLPLLQAKYHDYLEKKRAGVLSDDQARLILNRIRYALLSFAAQLKDDE